jgi:hypothetical protein
MSGTRINPLLAVSLVPLADDPRAAVLGWVGPNAINPQWRGAQSYELPKQAPPETYTGAIPNTQLDIEHRLSLPHEYYGQIQMLKNQGQYTPEIDKWLQAIYMQRRGQASW